MEKTKVEFLDDLKKLRTAPNINKSQSKSLFNQLQKEMKKADWFTLGIMANSSRQAVATLREIEARFNWEEINLIFSSDDEGPVFLKANQSTQDAHIRIEYGLGEGVLISCQHNDSTIPTETLGPFPLNFFQENK